MCHLNNIHIVPFFFWFFYNVVFFSFLICSYFLLPHLSCFLQTLSLSKHTIKGQSPKLAHLMSKRLGVKKKKILQRLEKVHRQCAALSVQYVATLVVKHCWLCESVPQHLCLSLKECTCGHFKTYTENGHMMTKASLFGWDWRHSVSFHHLSNIIEFKVAKITKVWHLGS